MELSHGHSLEPRLGFGTSLQPANLLYCFVGVLVGTAIGVLPGLGPLATISMLLPLTYALDPVSALIMLAGIYYGAQYGGSTTAILVNLPGEASSVVTAIDGHKMAKLDAPGRRSPSRRSPRFRRHHIDRFVAGFSPVLAKVALSFGPAEYFSLMVLGLVAAIILAHGSLMKAIGMVLVGLVLGTVGIDNNSGAYRFTFGSLELSTGLEFVSIAMGLFAFADIIANVSTRRPAFPTVHKINSLWPTRQDFARQRRPQRAELCSAPFSASCQAAARRWRPSRPIRWRRRYRSIPNASATGQSRAWLGRRPPTTPPRRPRSSRC